MIRLNNLLNLKERRLILYAGLFLFVVILFYFFIVRGQIRSLAINQKALSSKRSEIASLESSIAEKKKEYMRWIEARQDIKYVRDKYFYHGKISIPHIRQDLNELFRNTGVKASDIKYDYQENKDENFNKISISFGIEGTYGFIKKFLFQIRILEKFLYVGKITFRDIERGSGKIQLDLSLAVYYET